MLDLWQSASDQTAAPQPGETANLPATFGDTFDAALNHAELFGNSVSTLNARAVALSDFSGQVEKAGGDLQSERAKRFVPGAGEFPAPPPDEMEVANGALAALKAKNPAIALQPLTEDELSRRTLSVMGGANASYADVMSRERAWGGTLGALAGGVTGAAIDPINIPALLIAPEAETGYLASALIWGGYGAGSQAVNEAINARQRMAVDPNYSPATEIAEAGVGGAVMGMGVHALGNLWTRLKGSAAWPTSVRDAGNAAESEANIQNTNVLHGAAGEAAHRDALTGAIDQVVSGEPVSVQLPSAVEAAAHAGDVFPEPMLETRGLGQQYHGTSEPNLKPDGTFYSTKNYFGQGLYTTDAADVANGYARKGAAQTGERNVYSVSENRPLNLVDGEAPIPTEVRQHLQGLANADDGAQSDVVAQSLDDNPKNLREFYNSVRVNGTSEGMSADGIQEIYEGLRVHLEGAGYDGITHLGGLNTKTPPHKVNIYFKPETDVRVAKLDRQSLLEKPAAPRETITFQGRDYTGATRIDAIMAANRDTGVSLDRIHDAVVPEPAPAAPFRPPEIPATIDRAATLADPAIGKAMQAQAERLLDERAAAGKSLQIPVGTDANGPVYRSLADMLDDAKTDEDAAKALEEACTTPMSEAPVEGAE